MNYDRVALEDFHTQVLFCKQEETISFKFENNKFEMEMPSYGDDPNDATAIKSAAMENRHYGWISGVLVNLVSNDWVDAGNYGGYPWEAIEQSQNNHGNLIETLGVATIDVTLQLPGSFWDTDDGIVLRYTYGASRTVLKNVLYKHDNINAVRWRAYQGAEVEAIIDRDIYFQDSGNVKILKIPLRDYWRYRARRGSDGKVEISVENAKTQMAYTSDIYGFITVDVHIRGHATYALPYEGCVDALRGSFVCGNYQYSSVQRPTQYSQTFTTTESFTFTSEAQSTIPAQTSSFASDFPFYRSYPSPRTLIFFDDYYLNGFNQVISPTAGNLGIYSGDDPYIALGGVYQFGPVKHYRDSDFNDYPEWWSYWPDDMYVSDSCKFNHAYLQTTIYKNKWLRDPDMSCDDGITFTTSCDGRLSQNGLLQASWCSGIVDGLTNRWVHDLSSDWKYKLE